MPELYNIVSDEELSSLNTCTGAKNCDEGNYSKLNKLVSQVQNDKQTEVNNQRRLVQLNTYYGKKTSAQSKILKTIATMVVIVVALWAVRVYTGIITDWIITGAMSITIGSFIISILFQAVDITNRNNMDYDLYDTNLTNFPPLAKEVDKQTMGVGAAAGQMVSNQQVSYSGRGHCQDAECCPTFYTFNPTLGYCSLNPFT